LLLRYFGEKNSSPCGGCDVCLKTGRRSVPKDLFQQILADVERLKNTGADEKKILTQLSKQYEENDVVDVMRWFIDNKNPISKK
jgi:superfamily II DNA helicase RecQ